MRLLVAERHVLYAPTLLYALTRLIPLHVFAFIKIYGVGFRDQKIGGCASRQISARTEVLWRFVDPAPRI